MVADLVDQDMGDQLGQAHVAALAPFVQYGAAIQEDPRGLGRRPQAVAPPDVHPVVEAGQFEGVFDLHLGQGLFVGEVVDAEHHLPRRRPELGRQGVEGLTGQTREIVQGGGEKVGSGLCHPSAIAAVGGARNGAR
ncbi:hypothetical protein LTR94_014103 [Friedmanniomyces endolithicus]|nr:hypothetical protein LTR94_014103 [Friedmanniomyces endolithicus]